MLITRMEAFSNGPSVKCRLPIRYEEDLMLMSLSSPCSLVHHHFHCFHYQMNHEGSVSCVALLCPLWLCVVVCLNTDVDVDLLVGDGK